MFPALQLLFQKIGAIRLSWKNGKTIVLLQFKNRADARLGDLSQINPVEQDAFPGGGGGGGGGGGAEMKRREALRGA